MKKNILTLGAIALLFAACQNNGSQNNTMTNTTESTMMPPLLMRNKFPK